MNLEQIKNSLTSEISPILSKNEKTKLSSVLIIIFESSPKILMIKKPITMNYNKILFILLNASNNCVFFSLKWKYSSKEFVKLYKPLEK